MATGRPPGSSETRARFLIDERVRDGFFTAVIAVVAALTIRFLSANPLDYLHYSVLGDLTGIDFGQWPDIFYTSGNGDGEVFAVLAVDPLGSGPSQLIPSVVYRYGRIGMSGLAFMLSFGRELLVLPALFIIGLSAVGTVGFLSGFWRQRFGPRSWALVLNPAMYIGFMGDTAEPLGVLLLALGLVGSGYWAAVALGVTRPTYGTALFGRWRLLSVLVATAITIRLSAVWIFGGSIFDVSSDSLGSSNNFGPPAIAFFAQPSVVGFLVLASGVFTLLFGAIRRDLAWIVSGALVVALGEAVTANPLNAVRAAGMLPVLWALTQISANSSPSETSI